MGLSTVNSESCFGFSHTWGSRARVFAQIRFLQASYLQHDRRLPFLVGVSPLVDFVPASALTYHLRLARRDRDANRFRYSTSLVRINRARRHRGDRCSKSRWPRSGEQWFNKKPSAGDERFCLLYRRDCRTTDSLSSSRNRWPKLSILPQHIPAHDNLLLPHPQVNRLGISFDQAD